MITSPVAANEESRKSFRLDLHNNVSKWTDVHLGRASVLSCRTWTIGHVDDVRLFRFLEFRLVASSRGVSLAMNRTFE
mgnify:CR=1 FL=1